MVITFFIQIEFGSFYTNLLIHTGAFYSAMSKEVFGPFYTNLLIDTGAFSSAMPKEVVKKIQRLSPEAMIKFNHQFRSREGLANGQKTEVLNSVTIEIRIANSKFEEEF